MNRRIAIMVALSLLMVSLVGGSLVSARGAEVKPIRGFHVVTNFSETMYAGSAYEAYYRFRNIAKQEVPVRVRFIIIGPEIGTGEWFVDVTIDGDEVGCDEVGPGIFESSECRVSPKSWHDLRIGVSSRPDILPFTYALTMELHPTKVTGEIVDFVVPKRVILDEVAEFTVLFKNTGDVSLAARAFVEVRKGKKGKIVATENGALVEVGVGETVYLTVSWDTSDAKPGKYRAIAWVCFDSASTSTTEPERFKVKHGEKPCALTMQYTGESSAASNHHQDPKKVSSEGDPAFASPVHILATDKEDPDDPKAKIWFDGEVNLNEEFVIDATNAGETKLKSNTYVFIYATDNTLLQTIKFHTSCSQPLFNGDQFGSLKLVGFISKSECVVSGKHVARISTGDDASSIDNSMLDNSIL